MTPYTASNDTLCHDITPRKYSLEHGRVHSDVLMRASDSLQHELRLNKLLKKKTCPKWNKFVDSLAYRRAYVPTYLLQLLCVWLVWFYV